MFKQNKFLGIMFGIAIFAMFFANSAQAARYYCNGRFYTDPCGALRTFGSNGLDVCLNSDEYKEYKKAAFSSNCEKTMTKTRHWGNCNGTAVMGAKTKKVIQYSATDDYCLKKIKQQYPNKY